MQALLVQLSPREENVLQRIGFGADTAADSVALRRLLQLELIRWSGWSWQLTDLGRRRYHASVTWKNAAGPAD